MLRPPSLFRSAAAGGLILALGVGALVLSTGRADQPAQAEPTPTASPATLGDPALDALLDSLLNDDAAGLQARFASVAARAGPLLGGPIGIYQPQEVAASEWTALLGSAERSVHAVVKDPREPFEWWDQHPPGFPRAAILAAPRDFDIVLVVKDGGGTARPWRFSIANGRVIDVVIDRGDGPGGGDLPLVRKLGYLTPSPDSEPGRFLVLPPHEMRPAPPRIPPSGSPRPARVASPSLAPDGRTGDAAIDRLVDELLHAETARLATSYRDLPARQEQCDPGCVDLRVSPSSWTARLTAGRRSLYSVFTGNPADAEIVIALDTGSATEAFQFSVLAGRVAHVAIHARPSSAGGPLPVRALVPGHPSAAWDYERFYVLPPQSDLPRPPRVHSLSVRTSASGVDALLATLEARDASRLVAAFLDPAAPRVRACVGAEMLKDAAYASSWSREIGTQIYGVHSVTRLPAGYQPRADHLLIVHRQLKPYWWEATGILEMRGRIVGLITSDWGCSPESIYPPGGYIVPPPTNGLEGLDPSRRSGIAVIDAVLDAAAARDEKAIAGLISYRQVACGDPSGSPPGAGPPECPPGVAPGTPVDILPVIVCHGGHVTRDQAPKTLMAMIAIDARSALYAVVQAQAELGVVGATPQDPSLHTAVLASQRGGAVALTVGTRGVTYVRAGCGPWHPDALMGGGQPSFLLPPP